jgi:ABC-type multidrug transport system fused ATPase/permease subunit
MPNNTKELTPLNKVKAKSDYVTFIQAMWYFLKGTRVKFVFWVGLFALAQVAFIAYIELNATFINQLIDYTSTKNLNPAINTIWMMIGLVIISGIVRIFAKEGITRTSLTLQTTIKIDGMAKLMEFPISWHQKENSGNKIERLNTGADNVRQFLNGFNNVVLPSGLNLILVSIVFARLNWRYIIFAIVFAGVIYTNERYFIKRRSVLSKQVLKIREKTAGLQYETASNILTAKATDSLGKINTRVNESELDMMNIKLKIRRLVSIKWYIIHSLTGITIGIFLWLVVQDYTAGILSIGAVSVMLSYYKQLRDSINDLVTYLDALEENQLAVNRMYPIFTEQPDVYFGSQDFPKAWDQITISKASFNYPNTESSAPAITDMNMVINKFDKIGIVGHSGAGKSTLAKLLIGLYKLEEGEFKIGPSNYYDISHTQIAKNIAIVLQETELFNMSFKDNITLLKDFDPIRFAKAISVAQLQDVLDNLPLGVETTVGEKGYKLSGGQRQRLGIARAIYSDAPIIIFDEATSALDTGTERLIQDALDTQMDDKTLIFIAHRLSTLKNMNRIIVFEDGKIIEDGVFDELINNNKSIFFELWNLQLKK